MKAQNESKPPVVGNKYAAQFKEQSLEQAEKDERQLVESILYNWRTKRHQTEQPLEEQKLV